jgi:hypothetical protein
MRPQLFKPSRAMSSRILLRVPGSRNRRSIGSTPPACTHGGNRFFSGFEPAA